MSEITEVDPNYKKQLSDAEADILNVRRRQAEREAHPMMKVSPDGEIVVLPPHRQRVLDEKAELDIKIDKLAIFIRSNPLFQGLPDDDRALLRLQLLSMRKYSAILEQRIDLF